MGRRSKRESEREGGREKEKRVPETDGGGVRPENNIYRQRICDITSLSLSDRIEAGLSLHSETLPISNL